MAMNIDTNKLIYHKVDKIAFFLVLFFGAFSKNQFPGLPSGVMFSDVLVVFFLLLYSVHLLTKYWCLRRSWMMIMFIFMIWSLISAVYNSVFTCHSFSYIEYFRSFAKLAFYIFFSLVFYRFALKHSELLIRKTLYYVLLFHSLIALYILLSMYTDLHLPYKFLWFGQSELNSMSAYYRDNLNFIVAKGIFSEPSTLGIYLSLGLSIYLVCLSHFSIREYLFIVLIFITLLLTVSISTYILLILIIFLLYLPKFRKGPFGSPFSLILCVGVLFILSSIFSISYLDTIIQRIHSIVNMTDNSAYVRVIGSWAIPAHLLNESTLDFFFGIGLGDQPVARHIFGQMNMDGNTAIGWNMLAYVAGSTGIIGLLLFLVGIYAALRCVPKIGFIFFISTFASGNLLEIPFWMYLSLISAIGEIKTTSQSSLDIANSRP